MQSTVHTKTHKLLLVDHLKMERQTLYTLLSSRGYAVHQVASGWEALRLFFELQPDLVLAAIDLPDLSVTDLQARVRNFSDVPILLLGDPLAYQQKFAFPHGCTTAYLAKPLCPILLLNQVQQALSRHIPLPNPPAGAHNELPHTATTPNSAPEDVALLLDHQQYIIYVGGRGHPLCATEYRLLVYLSNNLGRTLTHSQLVEEIGRARSGISLQHLHTLIWRLRRKIEQDPKSPKRLVSHYGVGYSLAGPVAQLNK